MFKVYAFKANRSPAKPTIQCPSWNKKQKTYNSEDSPVVTHLPTNSPENCLCLLDLTG